MSELRLELGERLGLRKKMSLNYYGYWISRCFEYSGRQSLELPVTILSPHPNRIHIDIMINNNPVIENAKEYLKHPYANIKANAYDMVLNGEIGGGSIRIFQRELQEKMFDALGMSKEEALHKFGFLLGAFEYGAPRTVALHSVSGVCSIIGGSESIRDFIAFPKNNSVVAM